VTHILVTGGSGMVGTALKKLLPHAIYPSSKDYDLRYQYHVSELYHKYNPAVVVHLAATVSGIEDNIKRPSDHFDDNVLMNTLMVNAARIHGVQQFIGMLSTCIYPDVASSYPMTEDMLHESAPTITNFSYGYAKRTMAVQIDACNAQYGTNFQYLIPSNIYGAGDKYDTTRSHFVGALIRKIYEAKRDGRSTITLLGSGIAKRQFMLSDDLARVIYSVVTDGITDSFNVSPDDNFTIKEIAEIALDACGANHLQIVWDKSKPDGQLNKEASNAKFKTIFNDFRFTSLHDGIANTFREYKESRNG
jgi:GDP-L-fucose synthase